MEQKLVEVENLLKDATKKLQEISYEKQSYEELISILLKDRSPDQCEILNQRFRHILSKDIFNKTGFDEFVNLNEKQGSNQWIEIIKHESEDGKDLRNTDLIEINKTLNTEKLNHEEKSSGNSLIPNIDKSISKEKEQNDAINDRIVKEESKETENRSSFEPIDRSEFSDYSESNI